MAELQDPDRPAGFVVSMDEDTGVATRNDGKLLQPASKNPWYVLMTIAGEQEEEETDWDLHFRNRRYWNGWACSWLSQEKRKKLAECMNLEDDELSTLTREECDEIANAFSKRLPEDNPTNNRNLNWIALEFKVLSLDTPYPPLAISGIELEGIAFMKPIVADSMYFPKDVSFASSTFGDKSQFNNAVFESEGYFEYATFCRGFSVFDAELDIADFSNTEFCEAALFSNANFKSEGNFSGAVFQSFAQFQYAKFDGRIFMNSTNFQGHASFFSTFFSGYTKFKRARFQRGVDFQDATFEKPTSFRGAVFETEFPVLLGTNLDEDTEFSILEAGKVDERGQPDTSYWPDVVEDARAARASAAKIRHVMGKQGLPVEEHYFFRKEMGFNAQIGAWWQRLPYKLFHLVSEYGYSIERPVAGLGLVMGLPLGAYAALLETREPGFAHFEMLGFLQALVKAVGLSFANTFKFFGFQRLYFADFFETSDAFIDAVSGVQTVSGYVLLFFLGLGLRTRFRLK